MPILNVQVNSIGNAGVSPGLIFIETNDTAAEVIATGYLNKIYADGIPLNTAEMAIVSSSITPYAQPQVGIYSIVGSPSTGWSLVPYSSSSPIVGNPWVNVTTTPYTLLPNVSYTADSTSQVVFNPPAPVYGQVYRVVGNGSGGWLIQLPAGVTAHLGSLATSAGGTLFNTNTPYVAVDLVCTVTGTTLVAFGGYANVGAS